MLKNSSRSILEDKRQIYIPNPYHSKFKTVQGLKLNNSSDYFTKTGSKGATKETNFSDSVQVSYFPSIPKQGNLNSIINTNYHKIDSLATNPKLVSYEKKSTNLRLLEGNQKISESASFLNDLNSDDRISNYFLGSFSNSRSNIPEVKNKMKENITNQGKLKEILLFSLTLDSNKGLKDKVSQSKLIKKYRKRSNVNLSSKDKNESISQLFSEDPKISMRNKFTNTNINNGIDAKIYLNMKKYRLAKLIIVNLKLKEEIFIKDEQKKQRDKKREDLFIEFYNENPIIAMYELPELINQAVYIFQDSNEFFVKMTKILEKALETKDRQFYVTICKLFGKITLFYGEYLKSLMIYKQCLQDCEKYDLLRIKMSIYKRIGKLYLATQNFEKAKNNFYKMLHLALVIKSKNYEILAYDFIGLSYFYKNDIKKAIYFHTRMLKGQLEGDHSLLRDVAFTKLKSKKNMRAVQKNRDTLNCSSSIEHDSNFFDIKSENIENSDLKDFKKKFSERQNRTELSKIIKNNKGKVTEQIRYNSVFHKLDQIPNSKCFINKEISISRNINDKLFETSRAKNKWNPSKNINKKEYSNERNINNAKNFFFLSHLSQNRSLNVFILNLNHSDSYDHSKNVKRNLFLDKIDKNKILNSLMFLKKNIFLAVNSIKKMTKKDLKDNGDNSGINSRRKGLCLG